MKALMTVALLLAAATAFGGEYQFFFYPLTSPPEGGATIQITRNSFELDFRFGTPEILFGGVAASSVTIVSDQVVQAVTPAHAKGFVDVVLRMGGKTFTTASRFAFTPELETIILPVAVEMRGGYGTRWTTDIVIYNDGAEEVTLDREVCFFIGSIFPCAGQVRTINPGATIRIPARTAYPELSMGIVEPPQKLAGQLHFSVRVRDAEREEPGAGVEIPVVRARDLRVGRISLPNIPTSSRYRSTLRVYHGFYDAVFDVIARDENGRTLMRRHFDPGPLPTDAGGWDMTAIQGIMDDPYIGSVPNVRIDIESATAYPFWAMLSLTDNTTQQVSIYTPQ